MRTINKPKVSVSVEDTNKQNDQKYDFVDFDLIQKLDYGTIIIK